METTEPIKIKFKCSDFPKDKQKRIIIAKSTWRVGKLKGLVREAYHINPSYAIQLSLKGEILSDDRIIGELDLNTEKDSIKVMIISTNKM